MIFFYPSQAPRRQNLGELRIRCPISSLLPFSSIFTAELCFLIDSLSRTLQEWSDTMIINQLTFLLLFCLLGWSGALIRPVPGISTSDRDGRTLHRTKRGWMWNSFFLLEEWTGTGKQYVGKVRAGTLKNSFFVSFFNNNCENVHVLIFLYSSKFFKHYILSEWTMHKWRLFFTPYTFHSCSNIDPWW